MIVPLINNTHSHNHYEDWSRERTGLPLFQHYFRLNIVDEYNNGIGNVDQADQLCLQYIIHYWLCNRKWWWAIFFWAFECSLTNAYILFRKFYKIHERKPPFSHYKFVEKVALAWLKPNEFWPSNKSKKNDPRDNSSTGIKSIVTMQSDQSANKIAFFNLS